MAHLSDPLTAFVRDVAILISVSKAYEELIGGVIAHALHRKTPVGTKRVIARKYKT